ncbi:MAG: O-antigen ligase family protein, partial [Vicinamibacterales bacterium]
AQGRVRYRPSGIEVALVVWLGASVLSIPGSIDAAASWYRFGSDAIEYVGLFVVLSSTLTAKNCPAALKALIAAATLNACIAIADVGLHLDLAHHLGGGPDGLVSVGDVRLGFERAQGTFQHPAFLATMLAMAIPLTYGFFVSRNLRRPRLEHWAILGVQSAALGLTATRAAWFACALGILGVLIASVRRRPSLWWHLYGVLAMLTVALVVAAPQVNEVTSFVRDLGTTASTRSTATTGYRFELVRQSLEAVHARPLFGYGLGDFADVGIRGVLDGRALILTSPDNHLVRVVVETGVIGLTAFLILAVAIANLAVRTVRGTRRAFDAPTYAGLAWAVFAFGVVNLTISALPINQVGFYFWTIVAVLVVRRSSHRVSRPRVGLEHGLPPDPAPVRIS